MTTQPKAESTAPIYAELADRLRRSIQDGRFRPGQLIGSEHELARTQSISRMTVRRASEVLVNEGLLERRPGKGLYVRSQQVSTKVIQVIAGNLRWEPCLQVSQGVQVAAKLAGVQVQLYDAHGDAEVDLDMVRGSAADGSRGAIIISFHGASFNEAVYGLKMRNFPFVLVDQRLYDIEVPSVTSDNYAGGYQAGQRLLELGHQRIGFIGDLIASTVRDRLQGLRDAIGDAGLPFDRSLVADLPTGKDRLGDWSPKVEASAAALLSGPRRPTALFCSCDAVARSAYKAIAALGLKVPGDVSVIGFDDDPLAEWLTPSLTTVRQDFQAMGEAAFDLLRHRIEAPQAPVEHRVIPVSWIDRESIGRAM